MLFDQIDVERSLFAPGQARSAKCGPATSSQQTAPTAPFEPLGISMRGPADVFGGIFTHLPSNVVLVAVAFLSKLASGIARSCSPASPSRRWTRRPAGIRRRCRGSQRAHCGHGPHQRRATSPGTIAPVLAEVTLQARLVAPFVLAGALTSISDLGLYAPFRDVEVAGERQYVAHAADREGDP
jgi:hypothetical protein